jgi:drug/metabolite transporter (DMT)-like permease
VELEIIFRALGYAVIGLVGLTLIILLLIWARKEIHGDNPVKGIIWFALAIMGFCSLIILYGTYVHKASYSEKSTQRTATVRV